MVNYTPAEIADILKVYITYKNTKEIRSYSQIVELSDSFVKLIERDSFSNILKNISGLDRQNIEIFIDMDSAHLGIQAFADAAMRKSPRRIVARFLGMPEYSYHEADISEIYFVVNTWLCFFGADQITEEWTVCPYCSSPMKDYVCTNSDCKTRSYRAFKEMLKLSELLLAEESGKNMEIPDFWSKIKDGSEFDIAFKKPIERLRIARLSRKGVDVAANNGQASSSGSESSADPRRDDLLRRLGGAIRETEESIGKALGEVAESKTKAEEQSKAAGSAGSVRDTRAADIARAAAAAKSAAASGSSEGVGASKDAESIRAARAASIARAKAADTTNEVSSEEKIQNAPESDKKTTPPAGTEDAVNSVAVKEIEEATKTNVEADAKAAEADKKVHTAEIIKNANEKINSYTMRLKLEAAKDAPDFDGILEAFMGDSDIGEAMATGDRELEEKINEFLALVADHKKEASDRLDRKKRSDEYKNLVRELRHCVSELETKIPDAAVSVDEIETVKNKADALGTQIQSAAGSMAVELAESDEKFVNTYMNKVASVIDSFISAVRIETNALADRMERGRKDIIDAEVEILDGLEGYSKSLYDSVKNGEDADSSQVSIARDSFIDAYIKRYEGMVQLDGAETESAENCLRLRTETLEMIQRCFVSSNGE